MSGTPLLSATRERDTRDGVGIMAEIAAAANGASNSLGGISDLSESIERVKCHGLNISQGKPIANLFIGDERVGRVLCPRAAPFGLETRAPSGGWSAKAKMTSR